MSQLYWKASSIDNLTDARFFNAMDNAWIEFVFDVLEPRSVTIEQAKSIIEWLYEPNLLASFGLHQSAEEIFYVLNQSSIPFAAVPFEHELANDEDFASLAFIKLSYLQLQDATELEHPPFAFILSIREKISEPQMDMIRELLKYSKVFLQLPADINSVKNQLQSFDEIGIEIPTQPEQSPGWGAVDIYDHLIDVLES